VKKSVVSQAVLLSALLCSVFVATPQFSTVMAQSGTNVSGIISTDTMWTKAESPYNLAGPARVANGVTLTIEPGTTINLNGYDLEVNGTLVAVGTRTDPIQFSWGSGLSGGIIFSQSSTSWNEQTGSGCIIENALLSAISLSISSSPKIFNNSISGGQSVPSAIIINDGSPLIQNNIISGGYGSSTTISINEGSPVISNNNITGYVDNGLITGGLDTKHMARYGASNDIVIGGGTAIISNNNLEYGYYGVSVIAGTAVIERNLFGIFVDEAISVGYASITIIQNNTFTADSGGIKGVNPSTIITYNNMENTYSYDIRVSQKGTIDATNNWWGTTNASIISSKIQGTANFVPFLNTENPQALPNAKASPVILPVPQTKTEITVSAPSTSILNRTSVKISGTVVDNNGATLAAMPVTLIVVDPNGNALNLETATTDASGIYSANWTPQIEGTYAITAYFAGTQNYSSSQATINLTVGPSTLTSPPTLTPTESSVNQSPSQLPLSSSPQSPSQNPTSIPDQTNTQTPPQTGFYIVIAVLAVAVAALTVAVAALIRINQNKRKEGTQ
jgi:hypothetical protein